MTFGRGVGNLGSINKGNHKKTQERKSKSTKGYYSMAFTEPFEKLSERDLEIRHEYAKDAIARYYAIHKNYVQLRSKTNTNTGANLDEVFYVYVGQHPVGKVSIRISRFSGENNRMVLIYQHKNDTPKRKVKSKFTALQTETQRRRAEKKRKRASRKGKYKSTR